MLGKRDRFIFAAIHGISAGEVRWLQRQY
jgi:hypothetical protein